MVKNKNQKLNHMKKKHTKNKKTIARLKKKEVVESCIIDI